MRLWLRTGLVVAALWSLTCSGAAVDLDTAAEPVLSFAIIDRIPHDTDAFTQGFLYYEGSFYESTGLYGGSSLRKLDAETGTVLRKTRLPEAYFGEGLALWNDRLVQLTWKEETAFIYDRESFEPVGSFGYEGEGWGLTRDGTHLIMSDGSHRLYFRDPETFAVQRVVEVKATGGPVQRINELQYIHGVVYANIWLTDTIVCIDAGSGRVLAWVDLSGLLSPEDRGDHEVDVLNGIAYDSQGERLFVTGKLWPWIYEIELTADENSSDAKPPLLP